MQMFAHQLITDAAQQQDQVFKTVTPSGRTSTVEISTTESPSVEGSVRFPWRGLTCVHL